MLSLYFGDWTNWAAYDPLNGYLGPQKVTFDGFNKLILVNFGETSLDFRTDVYSAWKEWLLDPNHINSKYPIAISVIGGDPLPGARALGTTFFIENGWRMRTWDGDHSLTVIGNVYTREGAPIFVPTLERVTTTIELVNSTLPETLLPTVVLSNTDITAVTNRVWNEDLTSYTTANTAGRYVKDTSITTANTVIAIDQISADIQNINIPPAVAANTIADAVWSKDISANNVANTAGQKVDKLLKLAEADEELTSNTATKRDQDTGEILLVKTITGAGTANTVISITKP